MFARTATMFSLRAESCRGWKDAAILERAEAESRIVLTLDKDFWQIAATASRIEPLIRRFLDMKQDWAGRISAISTAELQIIQLKKP
jgi:predicted nuclease of predicted toxin-antitoxin system